MNGKEDALKDLLGALDVLRQCISIIDGSIHVITEGHEFQGITPTPVICNNCHVKPRMPGLCPGSDDVILESE